MARLDIRLFGGLVLESKGTPLPSIPSRSARSLFAYLVLNRRRAPARDLLAGTFWPDTTDAQARRRLSQALWQINTVLAEAAPDPSFIEAGPATVRFDPDADYWLDVEEFEKAATPKGEVADADITRLTAAADLYRGDLLAGFYDDWMLVEQHRLRERFFALLETLTAVYKSRGEPGRALVFARRLALHDPLREEAHREVMRLSYLAGRETEALAQYELCYSILQRELGAEPDPATTALYETISEHRRSGRRAFIPASRSPLLDASAPMPMVGRERPRARAVAALERALLGNGGALLVEGEPGVGKTRFLEAVAEDASWRGLGVMRAGASETTSNRSYGPIADALANGLDRLGAEQLAARVDGVWLREVARIIPELTTWLPDLPPAVELRPEEEPVRMRDAIAATLEGLAGLAPQLLIVDDLQWSDDDTVAALRHLTGRLHSLPLVLCVAYRRQPARRRDLAWDTLREIDGLAGTTRIDLEALGEDETGELIRASSAVPVDPEFAERLHRETGGNPLFVLETLRAMHETADQNGPSGGAEDLPLPGTVQEVISERLRSLDEPARSLLNTCAVLGEATLDQLAGVTGAERSGLAGALSTLVRRDFVRQQQTVYRFRHHQVQRVAYLEMGAEERRRRHASAGRFLISSGADDVELIAHHVFQAGLLTETVDYSELAARRALSRGAYATAASHFRTAVDAAREAGSGRLFDLLGAFETVLDVLGRRDEQRTVLARLAGSAGPPKHADVLRRRAWFLAHTGRFAEATAEAEAALEGDMGDRANTAEDELVLGTIAVWSGDPAGAVGHLEAAVGAATDPAVETRSRQALGSARASLQQYERAGEQAAAVLRLAAASGDVRSQADALGLLGVIAMEQGEVGAAVGHYRAAIDICRRIGYRHGEGVNLVNLANALLFEGSIAAALGAFAEAAELFRSMGNRRGEALVLANAASIHTNMLGDTATGGADCRTALEYFRSVGDQRGEALALCNLAAVARLDGAPADAGDLIAVGLDEAARTGDRWLEVQLLTERATLELDVGRPDEALATVGWALTVCRDVGLTDFEAVLRSLEGLAHLARGEAGPALEATAAALKKVGPGTERGYLIAFRHARALEAAGRGAEAVGAIRDAYEQMASRFQGLTAAQRDAALSVPEHRDIVVAYQRVAPRTIQVTLARQDAPTGRPLRPEETVEVHWTVGAPSDLGIEDPLERRRHRLRRLLDEAGSQGAAPTVADLAGALQVGPTTVRRDLAGLRSPATRGSRRR